jgi:surfactin synthase thioesterase subunit
MQNKPQLFCFTYAGGNVSFFDTIEKELTAYELVKLEYPGHGSRYKEHCVSSFKELIDDLYPRLREAFKGEVYELFGYSMGTITLVEILKRIIADDSMPLPNRVFLGAHEPHSKAELVGFTEDEIDEWVIERTIRFGAVPESLMNNKVFWRTYLPLYRADYSIIGRYRFEDLNLKTKVPATIFYSETDTPLKEMMKWKRYFVGDVDFYQYEGTHFFIQQHHKEIAEVMHSYLPRKM